jgi:hypothetical protein
MEDDKTGALKGETEKRLLSLREKLELIKRELAMRDHLLNLEHVSEGDYFLSFRRSGGGVLKRGKTVLSIKKLIDTFGYYLVNNNIIPYRHKVIRETLLRYNLIEGDSCVGTTFKTDTYYIKRESRIGVLPELNLGVPREFYLLTDLEKKALISNAIYEIQARMLEYIGKMMRDHEIRFQDIELEYGITAGLSSVRNAPSVFLLFLQRDFLSWSKWFYQKLAKGNSLKAAVLADLNNRACEIFSKPEFDRVVKQIKQLNGEIADEYPQMMERSGKHLILRREIALKLKSIDQDECEPSFIKALTYFSKIKILEEIIDVPLSFGELQKRYNETTGVIKRIDDAIRTLGDCQEKCGTGSASREDIGRRIEQIDKLSRAALEQLNIDYRNPEYSTDIKFFHESSSLKIGKYFLVLIDVKGAGIKIRRIHEKKVLDYADSSCSNLAFVELSFHSYDEFIQEIFDNQKKVKVICDRHMSEEESEEVLFLAFGDEIFILIPENKEIDHILSEINKRLEVNVRIVTTYFDVNQQINSIGSGKLIISAFDMLMEGDKVSKNLEKEKEDFRKIVLIDQNYSYKLIGEITETIETIEDVFVYTTMVSSGVE